MPPVSAERQTAQNKERLCKTAERQIEQHKDDEDGHRHHQRQAILGALHQFVLPREGHGNARLQRH